ncbi:MAG: hypothetical protein QXT92_03595 [Nitrososphaerota archaeon]
MTRPAIEHNITTSVGDLVVKAVDSRGKPVGANIAKKALTIMTENTYTNIPININFY